MAVTEEKRRTVRRLVGRTRRGFAEDWGFRVTNSPANLFQLLYLSILLRGRGDYRRAVRTAQALRDRGWDSAARMAASSHEERFRVVRDAGQWRTARDLATALGDLAQAIVDRYQGDLRRLRTQAHSDSGRERQLLRELPGVDDEVVDLFFRDVQAPWREVAPFADRRALAAARKLGLGRSVQDLSDLTGSRESEKLAWLVGALAHIDLDNSYDQIPELVSR
jgi:hypothetical protein